MNDLRVLWLPLAVSALAVLVLLLDVLSPPSRSPGRGIGWVVVSGLAALFAATFVVDSSGVAAFGAFRGGAWTTYFGRLFLGAGVLGALGALDDVAERMPRRQGEYWLTFLATLTGMTILPGARDLVLALVAFELVGIPLYVLAAYAKTDVPAGAEATKGLASEAAVKLYLVGVTSSAITLFGLALLTGMAGTSRIDLLAAAPMTPLGAVGLAFLLGGVGYKMGMVPFHQWVPDTYQGASTPFVAFLSVAPKAAGVSFLAVVFTSGLGAERGLWIPPLAVIALLSVAVGNILALPQTDLRRVLGYSGIAQMGYLLLAMAAANAYGLGMALFFLAAYVVTNVGAFLIVHTAARAAGGSGFDSLAGLARRSPGLAASLLCFLLSLAGIPFVVGFWAKLYVLLAAWRAGLIGLVAGGVVLSVPALFYYLRMLRAAYMTEPGKLPAPRPAPALRAAIALCVLGVVGIGLWPGPLVDDAMRAGQDLLGGSPVAIVATLTRR
jgi:NADH-quinone oxidoreductase subunit N